MMADLDDVLGDATTPKASKKAAKKAAAPAKATKAPAKATKAAAPAKAAKAPAKATKAAAVQAADDVSTTQPEDTVVLKAVAKLKEPTLASQFAQGLGVHRRVIRAQLQRLSKEKANGIVMKKDGFNWFVSHKA